MNHRYMPFGYYVKEGAVTVKTEEADVRVPSSTVSVE